MSYGITYKTDSNLVNSMSMPYAVKGSLMSSLIYAYDEFERLTTKEISLSTMATLYEDYAYYSYTDANDVEHATSLVSSVTHRTTAPNGTTTSAVYSYIYDNLGNITQIKKDGVIINEYTYDNLGQLVCEEDAVKGETYIYTYDKAGNITQKDKYPYSDGAFMGNYINYLADYKETVTTYTYGNTTWGDMLTAYNGTAITYDAIGNPLKWRNATSLTWEGRELQKTTIHTRSYVDYAYNSDGIRTYKYYIDGLTGVTSTHNYVLDGTRILSEAVTGSTPYTLYYLYDESGNVVGFIYNNSYYYYRKNLQGDVVSILNSSGSVVVEYTYDAWGKVLTTTGSLASTLGQYNPFRYRSYYYDREMGWYYLQSRYYDPTVGRFINADGIIGANGGIEGYNMFAYCNNNPVMYSDPSGYFSISEAAEEAIDRIGHALGTMGSLIISPLKAIDVEVGAGVGFGGDVEFSAFGGLFDISLGARTTISDALTYNKGKVDFVNRTSNEIGASIKSIARIYSSNIDYGYTYGSRYEHSYFDEDCTCNFWDSSFLEKSNCPANEYVHVNDGTFCISGGAYLILGFEYSISFDFEAWGEELVSIFNNSLNYD